MGAVFRRGVGGGRLPVSEFVYTVRGYSMNGRKNVSATIAVVDADERLVFEDTVKLSADKDRQRFAEAVHHIVGEDNVEEKLLRLLEKLPDTPQEKEEKPRLTARFPGLIDIVEYDGKPHFLLVEDGELRAKDYHEGQRPPDKEHLPYLLPRYDAVRAAFDSGDAKLFDDLIDYHRSISLLPSDDYYLLLASWDAHTYLMERWSQSAILVLFATPERGKSRTGKGVVYVSYRGIHTETVNEANLFRWSDDLGGMIFLDVQNLWRKVLKRGADDILLQRFEQGARVGRVLYPDRGPFEDTRYFDVYGPTLIATNHAIQNVLETRCLTIIMPDADRDYPNDVRPEMGLPLRERLVAFRARHLDDELTFIDKPCGGRLGEILRPLGTIIKLMAPSYLPSFDRLVKVFVSSRQEEKASTTEARIIEVMLELKDKVEVELKDGVETKKLAVGAITEKMNEGVAEDRRYSSQSIGHRLRALGFKQSRTKKSRAYVYDENELNRLAEKYGVAPPGHTSSPSSPPDINQIGDDVGDDVVTGDDVGDDVALPLSLSNLDRVGDDGDDESQGDREQKVFDRQGAIDYLLSAAETESFPLDTEHKIGPGRSAYESRLNSMDEAGLKVLADALDERLKG